MRIIICPDCNGYGCFENWDGTKKKCGMCKGFGVKVIDSPVTTEKVSDK